MIKIKKVTINGRDGYKLEVHIFDVKNEKAVIQIIHGMEEHQERYENFIKILNDSGFSVVSSDLRGHGKNCKDLGFFKEKEGYKELIFDQRLITQYIHENYSNLPIYIFSHSFGTIIARVLLQKDSKNYQKVVLSGYPNYQVQVHFGIVVSNFIKMIYGPKYKSKLLSSLSIDVFNESISSPKTDYDWICKNEETVKEYIKDPYCGTGFTCSAFNDLYHLVILMHKVKLYKNVNDDIKVLLIRGIEDPCTGFDKGAKSSYEILRKAGFKDIKQIAYPKMRHEILSEKDNNIVYNDILEFFKIHGWEIVGSPVRNYYKHLNVSVLN